MKCQLQKLFGNAEYYEQEIENIDRTLYLKSPIEPFIFDFDVINKEFLKECVILGKILGQDFKNSTILEFLSARELAIEMNKK